MRSTFSSSEGSGGSRPPLAYAAGDHESRQSARTRNLGRGRPGGYTLVEMMVVVAITSLVLSSVAVALHSLYRVDRRMRSHMVNTTTLTRLSLQLRRDAHRAVSVEKIDGENGVSKLMLALTDGNVVQYEAGPGRLLRIARSGEDVRHREVYRLPKKAGVRWKTEAERIPAFVSLEIVYQTGLIDDATDARRVDRIDAIVGLNTQYTNVGR